MQSAVLETKLWLISFLLVILKADISKMGFFLRYLVLKS